MKKTLFALLIMSLMTALAWGQGPIIEVEGGMIQGVPSAASDVTVFRGIPYAAPPVGDLRWERPQPVVKWNGVKVADTFSNICWQPGNAVGTFYGNEFYWKENTVHQILSHPNAKTPTFFILDFHNNRLRKAKKTGILSLKEYILSNTWATFCCPSVCKVNNFTYL